MFNWAFGKTSFWTRRILPYWELSLAVLGTFILAVWMTINPLVGVWLVWGFFAILAIIFVTRKNKDG